MIEFYLAIVFICTILYLILKHPQKKSDASRQYKTSEPSNPSDQLKLKNPSDEVHTDEESVDIPKKPEKTKTVRFKIAGCSFYEKTIKTLRSDNYTYELSKQDLYYKTDFYEKVFKYNFDTSNPQLIPEPDNEHDPNAVAVYVKCQKIGYIKKGNCSRVKNLMKKDLIKGMNVELYGGPYKRLVGDDDHFQVERDSFDGYFGTVELYVKVEDDI